MAADNWGLSHVTTIPCCLTSSPLKPTIAEVKHVTWSMSSSCSQGGSRPETREACQPGARTPMSLDHQATPRHARMDTRKGGEINYVIVGYLPGGSGGGGYRVVWEARGRHGWMRLRPLGSAAWRAWGADPLLFLFFSLFCLFFRTMPSDRPGVKDLLPCA